MDEQQKKRIKEKFAKAGGKALHVGGVINPKGERLVCPVCKSIRIKQDPKWEDNECLSCKRIWTKKKVISSLRNIETATSDQS